MKIFRIPAWECWLTLFGHGHVREFFLELDDEHAEAVRDAAAYHGDDEHGKADAPSLQVSTHDLRYLDVFVLRLLPGVLARLRAPGGHHTHWLRYETHRDRSTDGRTDGHLSISLGVTCRAFPTGTSLSLAAAVWQHKLQQIVYAVIRLHVAINGA